jgi:diacylglycerol kinase family enzyme
MQKEKACLIIHPKAEQHIAAILAVFAERWETTPVVTRYAGHGIEIAAHASRQNYRWVIAYGGDGMLNEVVNGAMQAEHPCIVGVLPGGTVNQWAHEIGLPVHPVEAALALTRSAPRKVDIGCVKVQALGFPDEPDCQSQRESKPTDRHHFLLVAGLGVDAATIRATSESAKEQYGQFAFILDWLRILPDLRPFPVQIHWSTGQTYEGQSWEVLVSNTRCYTNVENLIPDAYVNDGLLDIRSFSLSSPVYGLLLPFKDRCFSLRVPASVALELDGSSIQLADYVSRENWERLQQAPDATKILVTYQFKVKPAALPMAIPSEYTGELFNGSHLDQGVGCVESAQRS